MVTPEVTARYANLESLKALAGGNLIAQQVYGEPGEPADPDEDAQGVSDLIVAPEANQGRNRFRIPGSIDNLDVLGAFLGMRDPWEFGMLTKCVAPSAVLNADIHAIKLEDECSKRRQRMI